jgi:hypothetical protein
MTKRESRQFLGSDKKIPEDISIVAIGSSDILDLFLPPLTIAKTDDLVKSRQSGRHSKKLQMQGARILRNEAYIKVRCNDERCLPASGGKRNAA